MPEDNNLDKRGHKKPLLRRLAPSDKDWVFQTLAVFGGNKKKTAKKCGVSISTVRNVLKEYENPANAAGPELREARAKAMIKLASKTRVKAEHVLDTISDDDLASGLTPILDKDGEIIGYKHWGASASQKALTYGILTDKIDVQERMGDRLQADVKSGQLLLPDSISDKIDMVKGLVSSIKILQVDLREPADQGLQNQTQDVLTQAELAKATEVEILDDFADNPEG